MRRENFDTDKILRDIRTLSEPEKKYYKSLKIVNVFDDNYIEYESKKKWKVLMKLNHL